MIQMGARSYVPEIGRFLTPDPVPGGSANPYDYALQDPINNFDVNGMCTDVKGHKLCKGKRARRNCTERGCVPKSTPCGKKGGAACTSDVKTMPARFGG